MSEKYSPNKLVTVNDEVNVVKTYSYFRMLILRYGVDALDYLDGSNILVNQKLENIIEKFDSLITEDGAEKLTLELPELCKFKDLIDELNQLRLDLYNERLL